MADAVVETSSLVGARNGSAMLVMTMMTMTLVLGSCARSPTVVLTEISVDATVPPLLQLRTTVAPEFDPTQRVTNMYSSLFRGTATDRPAPYVFPLLLSIGVPSTWTGSVSIEVEGLDWDTSAVNAVGSTSAVVVAEHQTSLAVTLTAVVGMASPDGGAADDAAADDTDPADAADDSGDDATTDL